MCVGGGGGLGRAGSGGRGRKGGGGVIWLTGGGKEGSEARDCGFEPLFLASLCSGVHMCVWL